MHALIRSLLLAGLCLLAACNPAAPQKAQQAEPVNPAIASDGAAEDAEDADPGLPQTEQAMYGNQFDVLTYAPPVGLNGETQTFDSTSTSAHGFTGTVTFSALPIPDGWDSPTHPIRMTGANGRTFDLRIVENGGVEALKTLDWSKVMYQPIGMADYLNGKTTEPGTLVFVFEVIKPVPAPIVKNDLPCASDTRFLAVTAQHGEADGLSLATFSTGSWPPANPEGHCGTYHYVKVSSE